MSFMLFFPARFAHAPYSSRMIDRFLNWGDHGKPKSGKIKGRCPPPPGQGLTPVNRKMLTYVSFGKMQFFFSYDKVTFLLSVKPSFVSRTLLNIGPSLSQGKRDWEEISNFRLKSSVKPVRIILLFRLG